MGGTDSDSDNAAISSLLSIEIPSVSVTFVAMPIYLVNSEVPRSTNT